MLKIMYFPYIGPSWRSNKTVVEIRLDFENGESDGFPPGLPDVRNILVNNGILTENETFPRQRLPQDRKSWCASLLAQTALLFQQKSGHRVEFFDVLTGSDQDRVTAVLEYEQGDVGITSVKLAHEFLSGQRKMLAEPFRMFREFAHVRLLPQDTAMIMKVARQRDIPCFHLERFPFHRDKFSDLTGGDCIRRNGLLMLGHGAHQHVLDGMFCLDKNSNFKEMYKSKAKRMDLLKKLSIPIVEAAKSDQGDMTIYDVLVIHASVIAVIDRSDGSAFSDEGFDESFIRPALSIHQALEKAPLVVSMRPVVNPGSAEDTGAGVIDFDIAPRLDEVLGRAANSNELLESSAQAMLDWLIPAGTRSSMPIFAVTGTNGKTTTTRMINHVLMNAGRKTGMVCTDGIFFDDDKYRDGDSGTVIGHVEVLTNRSVDAAVLETHHRGILRRGFAFDRCDFAVCLNVTDDHLGDESVETVTQMARVKQALPERASKAAILNADDPHCLQMRTSLNAKHTCLVSMVSGVGELHGMVEDGSGCFCVIERLKGVDWIVIYHQDRRVPIVPVSAIPATFDGAARFNVSNAMHAIAATYLGGIEPEMINRAMRDFRAGLTCTPGRMNVIDDLPFRIIMDFAHNPDGMRRICEFVDAQTVSGRKVLAFSGIIDRNDETIKNVGRAVAGHFDFYFCKDYVRIEGKAPRSVTDILLAGLLEKGVSVANTALKTSGKQVIFEIFDSCQPGDLLMMLIGHTEKDLLPGYIKEYAENARMENPGEI